MRKLKTIIYILQQSMNNSKNEIMKEGIIYKAVNLITNEVYIGATTKSIEERKIDHFQKSDTNNCYKFQNAICNMVKTPLFGSK